MDIFTDTTYKSFFVNLLTDYLQLSKSAKVQTIQLSPATLALVGQKEITFPSLPLVVDESKKKFTSTLSIAIHLLEKSRTKHLLLGQSKDDFLTTAGLFELLERKRPADLFKHFNDIFEKKTFLNRFHVTVGDLYLFAYLFDTISAWTDENKLEFGSLFRWFYHIQGLPGIEEFLTKAGKSTVAFPK